MAEGSTGNSTFTNNDNDNNTDGDGNVAVIAAVVSIVLVLLLSAIIVIWCYRRKTGKWPKPCHKQSRSPVHRNPYGSKSYSHRWKNAASVPPPVVVGHKADYRDPTPQNQRKVNTITERISERLHEASEKLSRSQGTTDQQGSAAGRVNSSRRLPRSWSHDAQLSSHAAAPVHKMAHSYSVDFGLYHDRTLPATLMMTSESKQQKFENEDREALKRSNSATLRSSSGSTSSRNRHFRPDSARVQDYNDFGPGIRQGRIKRKGRRTSNLSSSRVSSKPSNTSDYVSDYDTLTGGASSTWKSSKHYQQVTDPSECNSVLHDSFLVEQEKMQRLKNELHLVVPPLAIYRAEAEAGMISARDRISLRKKQNRLIDDRTESQQNTMRSDGHRNFTLVPEDELSGAEGQSSGTESMSGSANAGNKESSFRRKERQYESDNDFLESDCPRRKSTKEQQFRRTRSLGLESNPNQRALRKKLKNRRANRGQRKEHQGRTNPAFEASETSSVSRDITGNSRGSARRRTRLENKERPVAGNREPMPKYHSASLKTPRVGTVVEMPIYSQETWSGPGGSKTKPQFVKKFDSVKEKLSSGKKTRKNKRSNRTGRKLSIGGNGRFYCEYGSLPIDLSKVPKDLVAKLGGQTDQLLEPIEQLNFEQLCRPLPQLGNTEGELSARHLVIDRLPPDHRDRELLSNTYEYEDTGLVMTDL